MTELLVRVRPSSSRVRRRLEAVPAAPLHDVMPAWRGLLHEKALGMSPALGLLLVLMASGPTETLAASVFALTMTGMLAASALNHRGRFGLKWELRFRRADHAAIGLFLAGTWTALALLVVAGPTRLLLGSAVWATALAMSVVAFAWLRIPGWLMAAVWICTGWPAATVALGHLASGDGRATAWLFVAGGLAYTAGGVGYAFRRPNLHPAFGYHEMFHALVLAGAALHYLTLALLLSRPPMT